MLGGTDVLVVVDGEVVVVVDGEVVVVVTEVVVDGDVVVVVVVVDDELEPWPFAFDPCVVAFDP